MRAVFQLRNPIYSKILFVICLTLTLFAILQFGTERFPYRLSPIANYVDKKNSVYIHNESLFKALRNDSVIIVVQVHTRIEYLRHLIESLEKARNISDALVIFSHDFRDEKINELVHSIKFCKVIQIFFPFSIQKYNNKFPGEDPNDCERNLDRDQAIARKCNNALHPDLYGHYREAKFTQTKHHWWWKANHIFDQLDVTRYHTGLVLFLEEDHYVAEDFLHVLTLMQNQMKNKICRKCNIISLGTYLDFTTDKYHLLSSNEIKQMPWISVKHNMGFAFNRSTWQEVVRCANQFCTYDDYNWDWTLQYISEECLAKKFHALVAKKPHVFHIGECGLHHKDMINDCRSDEIITQVRNILAKNTHQLYPKSLRLVSGTSSGPSSFKPNGGWGDIRDHNLCLSFTSQKSYQHI